MKCNKSEFDVGESVRVFDYGNEIYDKIVTIMVNDFYSETILFQTNEGELFQFSGQGYFEEI